ncbi:hypothetical protein [Actinospica robiniae]|uniref:hypothetical protein n=1 Tax=Actinospica robiniae TaxID=304901 RepID=UPI00041E6B5A|nr:hypothetical protein [Actinospica robiniae]
MVASGLIGHAHVPPRRAVLGVAAEGGGVTLRLAGPDGARETLHADHVIAATGYRIAEDSFTFLSSDINDALARVNHWPRLGAGYQSSIPGLYFVGFPSAASYGPLMRFVCGSEYASPRLAQAIHTRVRERNQAERQRRAPRAIKSPRR